MESVFKLNANKPEKFRFVGEDSSFILDFEKIGNNIRISQNKKIFCVISFDDFARAIWNVSELLFIEYGNRFDDGNIAKEDWLSARKEVAPIVEKF